MQFMIIRILVLCMVAVFALPGISYCISLDSAAYKKLRENFLNIDTGYFQEIVLADYEKDPTQDFLSDTPKNVLGYKNNDVATMGWYTFGANYWTSNSLHKKAALARFTTGGSPENNTPVCGSSVVNNYQTAIADSAKWCRADTLVNWSGTRIWLGLVGGRTTFISDSVFTKFKNKPMNRLCLEFELPASKLAFPSVNNGDNGIDVNAQLVNPETAHPNLKWIRFLLGTYTSVYNSDNLGVSDSPEEGETFHGGGMHFYHKPASYGRYPLDKAFAIAESTVVVCFAPAPSGVRSGMDPGYSANPLMTFVPNDALGQTFAPEYFNYVTRAYVDIGTAKTRYPVTVKLNKVFALYESNEIFAMDKRGGIMGVSLVKDTVTPAFYPFVIYNWAKTNRRYMPTLRQGDLAYEKKGSPNFQIFIDDNKNSKLDSGEVTQIMPCTPIELLAGQDLHLIVKHKPEWNHNYSVRYKWDRKLFQAFFTLQEIGRLRMASYGVRTWLGTEEEYLKKDSILLAISFPPNSQMQINAKWNHEKPNNMRLIKNSPDYLAAINKQAEGASVRPETGFKVQNKAASVNFNSHNPVNLRINQLSKQDNVYIINSRGEKIQVLYADIHGTAEWNGYTAVGKRVCPGVYFYMVVSGANKIANGKLIVLR